MSYFQSSLAAAPSFDPSPYPAAPVADRQSGARPLESVRPERRAATAARRLGWFLVLVVVVALFGLAGFHSMIVQQQRQVDGLNAELAEMQAQNDELKVQLTQLEAPDRILSVARDELGMIYTEPSEVTWLEAPTGQLPEATVDQVVNDARP